MSTNDTPDTSPAPENDLPVEGAAPGKVLSAEAQRALSEAVERRRQIDARAADLARNPEHQGRGGLEPVRYTDWEIKGIAADF